jgi:hypothetical protein
VCLPQAREHRASCGPRAAPGAPPAA